MIWIDLKGKSPTDKDIKDWTPWTQEQWEAWLKRSNDLVSKLAELDTAGKQQERNQLIDKNCDHWGSLKKWLLALSAGKCWFSDVGELYSHYDVEHFRPKKEAKEIEAEKHRDGYWWLAFDYMNLRVCGNVGNRKKGGWFPLQPGSQCSTFAHQCEESECPYLLDPIEEADVALLSFDEEGKAVAAPGSTAWEEKRVELTVDRLKLNAHAPLAEARRKIWQRVDREIAEFHKAKARCATGPNPAAKESIRRIRANLRDMTSPAAELSSVAKWCIILRNEPMLTKLIT